MAPDAPFLERLAQLPAVPVAELVDWLERMPNLAKDPLLAGLVGVDEGGEPALHPLLAAVVARLRAAGLPPDDLLLRLQTLSPTLGFQAESREWAQQWMTDPTAQDARLVQQCLVRLLLALRGLAEARARGLTDPGAQSPKERP